MYVHAKCGDTYIHKELIIAPRRLIEDTWCSSVYAYWESIIKEQCIYKEPFEDSYYALISYSQDTPVFLRAIEHRYLSHIVFQDPVVCIDYSISSTKFSDQCKYLSIYDRIIELQKFYRKGYTDGCHYCMDPIDVLTLENAKIFLHYLFEESIVDTYSIEVFPTGRGTLQYEFCTFDRVEVEIEIGREKVFWLADDLVNSLEQEMPFQDFKKVFKIIKGGLYGKYSNTNKKSS